MTIPGAETESRWLPVRRSPSLRLGWTLGRARPELRPTARATAVGSALLLASAAGCAAAPPPATIEIQTAQASAATPIADPARFYLKDPLLDGLEPSVPWTVRQETFGATQHCYELLYPESRLAEVAAWTNAELARRNIPAKLPESVHAPSFVVHLDDKGLPRQVSPRLAPTEPLIKLILCHVAVPPVPTIHESIARLVALPAARELAAFGKPDLAWKREYRDRPPEYGLSWPNLGKERAAAVLVPLGYVESFDATKRRFYWRRGEQAFAWTPGSDLWWDAVR